MGCQTECSASRPSGSGIQARRWDQRPFRYGRMSLGTAGSRADGTRGLILGGDMKAAVVRAFGAPLVIEDRPIPEPGPGQITVRMEASGLCHTDIHAAHGDWPVKPTPPFVPGHEGVGTVYAIGAGV